MATAKIPSPTDQDRSSSSQYEFPACGYVVHGLDTMEERWKCIFCNNIIKEPIQFTECGHRACRGCYESRMGAAPDSMIACPDTDCKYSFDRSQVSDARIAADNPSSHFSSWRPWSTERSRENSMLCPWYACTKRVRTVRGAGHCNSIRWETWPITLIALHTESILRNIWMKSTLGSYASIVQKSFQAVTLLPGTKRNPVRACLKNVL